MLFCQVWALYDDEGLPRFYALVKSVTTEPQFKCTVAWLDPKWEEVVPGCARPVGPIVKARSTGTQDAVMVFSHLVEPQGRFPLKVMPKLGEVWACFVPAMDVESAPLMPHGFVALRDGSSGDKVPQGGHLVYVLAQMSVDVDDGEGDGATVLATYLRRVPGYNSVYEVSEPLPAGTPLSILCHSLMHGSWSRLRCNHAPFQRRASFWFVMGSLPYPASASHLSFWCHLSFVNCMLKRTRPWAYHSCCCCGCLYLMVWSCSNSEGPAGCRFRDYRTLSLHT